MRLRDLLSINYYRQKAKAGLLVIVIAALTFEGITLVQFYFSRSSIRQEAERRAQSELETTKLEIIDVIDQTETGLKNSLWLAQWALQRPDSIIAVSRRVVENNPVIVGSTLALVPDYDPARPLFAPYVVRQGDSLVYKSLATEEYNYPRQEWFTKPLETGLSYWSEPYWDEGGGEILMTTFSLPVMDAKGRIAAILTADISLDWLTELVGEIEVYPKAFGILTSRSGQFMVCPEESLVMTSRMQDMKTSMDDTTSYGELSRAILSGEAGSRAIWQRGKKYYVYFAPVERTGWSMSIVIPNDEIYGTIRKVGGLIAFLQLLGVLLLLLILQFTFRNQLRMDRIAEKEQKMENDLRIASNIQMAMIPKASPAFMARHDLDIAAGIVPAREVGGDLYDFFVRDEKLFFCIGDVSGKGVPAALVMAMTRSQFRTLALRETSPARIVSAINDSMSEANENNMFVTFFCGVLDLVTGHLLYCNAGHNAPLSFSRDIRFLDVLPNVAIGIVPGMEYQEQDTYLIYDDALFLYTDGITEAENTNQDLFGEERLIDALRSRRRSEEQLNSVRKAINAFVGEAPQSDDKAMLFLHYLNPRLVLRNEISEISRLEPFVGAVLRDAGCNDATVMNLNLALEEVVTNVVLYAYPSGMEGTVSIEARQEDGVMSFIISDSGRPFDPTLVPDADTTLAAEDRAIGGLGIFLVRNLVDDLSYERKDDKNYLYLKKKI